MQDPSPSSPSIASPSRARPPRVVRADPYSPIARVARRSIAFGLACAASLGVVPTAKADTDWGFAFGMNGSWLRKTPTLTSDAVETEARVLESGRYRMRGSLLFLGPYLETTMTIDDRWLIPLGGFGISWAVGSYDATVTSVDGSITNARPWTSTRLDVLLPGFGRRFTHRRNMWGFVVRTGASALTMDASVASGSASTAVELGRWTFLAQVEVEGCRRLDPTFRACAFVAPRVYDHDFMGGVSVGLRAEWGR